MRYQFVLDKRSKKVLDDLAQYRGGNRSRVVREALVTLADMEVRLDKIEADPAFQKMMTDSDQAIRRRVTAHEVVVKMALSKRQRRKSKQEWSGLTPHAISRWSFPGANSGVFSTKSGYSNTFPA